MAEESKNEKRIRKEEKKKLKQAELEEIEINLNADIPLNKKQQRLLKKGKLNLDKIKAKHPPPKPEPTTEQEKQEAEAKEKQSSRSKYGVWIGNLSFDTQREDIVKFITAKTANFGDKVEESHILRLNMPKKGNNIKGFCYVDLPDQEKVESVLSLSESQLNGRNLLIKDAHSFEGRPEKSEDSTSLSKNPPSRILFVGNLSFDTTDDLLEEHFRHCGDIVKIRMATFEDSGKCKGFAFIDFKDETGPTTALKSKLAKKLINRPLRLEFGEDRSKRTPNKRKLDAIEASNNSNNSYEEGDYNHRQIDHSGDSGSSNSTTTAPPHKHRPKPRYDDYPDKRQKSSIALANAQRASAAIVPGSGKKTTFD